LYLAIQSLLSGSRFFPPTDMAILSDFQNFFYSLNMGHKRRAG